MICPYLYKDCINLPFVFLAKMIEILSQSPNLFSAEV